MASTNNEDAVMGDAGGSAPTSLSKALSHPRHGNRQARRPAPYPKKGGGGGAAPSVDVRAHYSEDKARRVYVGNLSWETSSEQLQEHMETGTGCAVTRADVLQKDGRSKGCGIVEFESPDGARKAVLMLNDSELLGRQMFVREDREDSTPAPGGQPSPSASGPAAHRPARNSAGKRVYVGNLPWDVAWQDLKDHMRQAGEVSFAKVIMDGDGRSMGCGIVEYATVEGAQEAITTLTDSDLNGRMIFVREDRESEGSGGGAGAGNGNGPSHGGNNRRGGGHAPSAASGGGGGGTSVYVGNLSYETSWQDLKDHMRQAGNVDQANILQDPSGRSKGCGIVKYQKPQDAARAIRDLQDSDLDGRPIFVREDRERGSAPGAAPSGGGGGGGSGTQLYVGNLSWDVDWMVLKDHFRTFGDVERAEVISGHDGRSKGFGTVRFSNADAAQAAIEALNGTDLMGRNIDVRLDHKAR